MGSDLLLSVKIKIDFVKQALGGPKHRNESYLRIVNDLIDWEYLWDYSSYSL